MSLNTLISSYTKYNHWANEVISQWLKTIDKDLLFKETPSSFNSLAASLQHMSNAQRFWLAVTTEGDGTQVDQTIKPIDPDLIMAGLLAGSQKMLDIYLIYTEEEMEKNLPTHCLARKRYEYILLAINHNTYHRGQIVTMSRTLSVIKDIPEMDYEVFLWHHHPATQSP